MEKKAVASTSNWFSKWWLREPFLFVVTYFIFMFGGLDVYDTPNYLLKSTILFTIFYAHAQLNQYYLLPIWLKEDRVVRFIVLTLINAVFFSIIGFQVEQYLFAEEIAKTPAYAPTFFSTFSSILSSLLVISGFAFIRMMYENREREQQQKLLLNEMENHLLRAQVNPHFLFNSLNNLYGVSLEQPERTPDLILQFAGLMRYSLEAARRETVDLADELAFVKNYVALETERVGQRCRVVFEENFDEKTGAMSAQIAPMLLAALVENAFKHSTATVEKCWVEFKIGEDAAGGFFISIRNSMPSKKARVESTGTGLENTRQRLERLYPNRHEFRFGALKAAETSVFEAFLAINLR